MKVVKLSGLFKELQNLPQIEAASVFSEGVEYRTHTFINGYLHNDGEIKDLYCTEQEVIALTKGCVQYILKEYSKVWVRVFPELATENGKFRVYMRLAF